MVFEKYAHYYDLLYQDKDYEAECDYLISLVKRFKQQTKKILEFGSGSGIHGRILANAGFEVIGIERSQEMIDLGLSSNKVSNKNANFSCFKGDCTSAFIGNDFDSVISLFHVLSYQTSDDEVLSMLMNANRQLKQGGIFILDYWYAPAVWNISPSIRVKKVKNEELVITRIAEPQSNREKNLVKVNYQTFIENLKCHTISKIEENHTMRAFTIDLIEFFSKKAGFSLVHSEEWISGNKPSNETWGVCSILKKS